MTEHNQPESVEVERFILDRIESVPHLEALLLLWRSLAESFSTEQVARHLWVKPEVANGILQDLTQDGFLKIDPESGKRLYRSDLANDRVIGLLSDFYQKELIRVSRMIHSKPSAAVREFARAFRMKKDE